VLPALSPVNDAYIHVRSLTYRYVSYIVNCLILASSFQMWLSVWLPVLVALYAYMFYSMNNPPECPYKSACLLSHASIDNDVTSTSNDGIACRKYQRSCYAPLWSDKNHMVDIQLYVSDTSVLADGRVSKPRPKLVWNVTNHRVTERLACNITYYLLSHASMTEESVSGTFYFISRNTTAIADGDIVPVPVVSLKVTLAERRKLFYGYGDDRKRARSLVDSSSLAKVVDRSAYYGYMNSNGNGSESAIFWKFLHQPITIRFAEVYAHVSRHTLTSLLAHDIIVHDTRPRPVTKVDMHMKHPSVIVPRYRYEPLLWLDDLSITQRQYAVINMPSSSGNSSSATAHNISINVDETPQTVSIKFQFDYVPTSPMYFGIKKIAEKQLNTITDLLNMGNKDSGSNEIVDELRYYLSERHLYQLLVTQVIAMVHIVFEYLAFRDDLSFFSRQKSFTGLSSSGLYFAFIRNLIVFLYLFDNDTSWIVLFSVAKDALYTLWKILQVLRPNIIAVYAAWKRPISLLSTPLSTDDDGGVGGGDGGGVKGTITMCTEEERRIMEYDSTAVRYCSYLLCPMLAILSAYNLKTTVYASWWSWCISSLVDFVYLFGFISMVPQLYINYKLKSVAHLPIRAFMFKLFNTFIDDVFVLLMKMPLKHRLMALRDDVIFLGFLYQWWIYPSDKSRVNEFGYQYSAHE